jgi:hypothetical protein
MLHYLLTYLLVGYGIAESDVGNYIPASYMIQYPDYHEQHSATETNENLELKLHRGNVMMELIKYFKDPDILKKDLTVRMINSNGQAEEGIGEGVLRDAITEFWNNFLETCTVGHSVKIPFLRHDFGVDEWMSVSRIIAKGWQSVGYFPVQLSQTLIEEVLYGHSMSSIFDAFMEFINPDERCTLIGASKDFSSVSTDDIIDVLDSHSCHRLPNAENLNSIITEIAHKEIVQVFKWDY